MWLTSQKADPQEPTLWNCSSDKLSYRCHDPTMRNIYRILALQYDLLGDILPFTARAKILVKSLWQRERRWKKKPTEDKLLLQWQEWVGEHHLPDVCMPRCYSTPETWNGSVELHVFCNASEHMKQWHI